MSKNKAPNVVDFANGPAGFSGEVVLNVSSKTGENEQVFLNTNGQQFCNKGIYNKSVSKLITSAQLLALNATPIEVIPACGAGYFNRVRDWFVSKPAGVAYAGIAAGEDLALKYTDGSGAVAATVIETTGFLDQTTVQQRAANALSGNGAASTTPGGYTPVSNAAIVVQLLSGEITTGDSPLYIYATYDIIPSDSVPTA